jgi:hypothetical protein
MKTWPRKQDEKSLLSVIIRSSPPPADDGDPPDPFLLYVIGQLDLPVLKIGDIPKLILPTPIRIKAKADFVDDPLSSFLDPVKPHIGNIAIPSLNLFLHACSEAISSLEIRTIVAHHYPRGEPFGAVINIAFGIFPERKDFSPVRLEPNPVFNKYPEPDQWILSFLIHRYLIFIGFGYKKWDPENAFPLAPLTFLPEPLLSK